MSWLMMIIFGLVYQQQERFREAIEEMQQAVSLSGASTEALTGLAQTYAAAGMSGPMRETVNGLRKEGKTRYVSPYNVARIYGSLKDNEQTFAWLEKAYDEHHPDMIELTTEPCFDSVRSDPRFEKLLSRVGFVNAASHA